MLKYKSKYGTIVYSFNYVDMYVLFIKQLTKIVQ